MDQVIEFAQKAREYYRQAEMIDCVFEVGDRRKRVGGEGRKGEDV